MEDYHVAEFRKVKDHEVGLFAVYDGHLGHNVADYLQQNLFNNILNEVQACDLDHYQKLPCQYRGCILIQHWKELSQLLQLL